jgi:hypothetical protein
MKIKFLKNVLMVSCRQCQGCHNGRFWINTTVWTSILSVCPFSSSRRPHPPVFTPGRNFTRGRVFIASVRGKTPSAPTRAPSIQTQARPCELGMRLCGCRTRPRGYRRKLKIKNKIKFRLRMDALMHFCFSLEVGNVNGGLM